MLKITDTDYYLPKVYALHGIELFKSGTTQPMLIRGICTTKNEKDDYVVKYINSPRMSVESSCRELIAAFIAKQLDIYVAEPVLVTITQEFVETLRGMDGFKYAQNSLGLNFGCKYVPEMIQFLKNQALTLHQYDQAQRIFALDIFISNSDRRNDKQNMLTDGEKILIFDHELAFGFVMDIIKNPKPWILSDSEKVWIKNHFFYPVLRENEHNFDTFAESLERIDGNFWNRVYDLLPEQWLNDRVDVIRKNLTSLIENKIIFLQEIYNVLS